MRESSGTQVSQTFELYRRLVLQTRDLGRIRVYRSLYIDELSAHLRRLGGVHLWLGILLVAVAWVIVGGDQTAPWARVLTLLSLAIIAYIVSLETFGGMYADIWILLDSSAENRVYTLVARRVCNRITAFLGLPVVVVLMILLGSFQIHIAVAVATVFVSVAILGFSGSSVTWLLKHFKDYYRIAAAFVGRKTVIVRTTEELVADVCSLLQESHLLPPQVDALVQLADSDLRRAESRIELTGLGLSAVAILVAVFFSQEMSGLLINGTHLVDEFARIFGHVIVNSLSLSNPLNVLFTKTLYVVIWFFCINALIGLGFLLLRSLLNVYFGYYRPAHALQQSLILLNTSSAQPPQASIQNVLNTARRLLRALLGFYDHH